MSPTGSCAVTVLASPPPGEDPVPSGTILVDTRAGGGQSIQGLSTMAEAVAAIQSSPAVRLAENNFMFFTTDLDGSGTRAFRAQWNGWNGVPGGQGRRIRTYFQNPQKTVYIQWKNWLGRTPTGGGIGAIGFFDVTNELDPVGNAGRKYLLMPRAGVGGGPQGRVGFNWSGPTPVTVHWVFDPFAPSPTPTPSKKVMNRSPFDPEAHYNEVITFTAYFQAESALGAGDGVMRLWYNGVLRGEHQNQGNGEWAIDRFNMCDTFQSPIQNMTEYFWDLVVWKP